ncbi:MAG TPA: T9SS type A sorting domain-containing protein [Flavobacteriaceae bacterium]|nr:T9SS type A sorting domain-containing protein [Flavobacteriaceae bacterium]
MKQIYKSTNPKNLYNFFVLLFLLSSTIGTAQTTNIPDTQFEQILINEGIDSDGTINGQVLTSDIVGVLNLNLQQVQDLTGLQDFTALESLTLYEGGSFNGPVTLDLTANTNLKKLEIYSFSQLSKLKLTGLTNLEELILSELQGDVITMEIDSLDLSTNTNINKVNLGVMDFLQTINLQNGNNANMLNFELELVQAGSQGPLDPPPSDRPMCIKVDDATAAMANTTPYDSWIIYEIAPTFYDTGQCVLSVNDFETIEVALFPNPATELFRVKSQQNIKTLTIYDLQGNLVKHYTQAQESYSVAGITKGLYLLKVQTLGNQKQFLKFIKK